MGLDGVYVRNVVVWEVFGLFLAAAAFYTIPIGFATLRAHGLLKLFRVAPITRSQVLVSFFTASFLYVLLFTVVMLVLNAILYGLYFPFTFDSIALLLLAAFLGGAAMISLGLILPTIFRSVSAIAPFGTLLFLPRLFYLRPYDTYGRPSHGSQDSGRSTPPDPYWTDIDPGLERGLNYGR